MHRERDTSTSHIGDAVNATTRTAYLARWILPISAPPIEDGALIVEGSRIALVTTAADMRASRTHVDRVIDLGNAVLMPGLVSPRTRLGL